MVNKGIKSRIARLEGGGRPTWIEPCPDCGLWPGRIVHTDPARGIGLAEALGCETCVRLRAAIPPKARGPIIEINRSTPPADPRRRELLRQYAGTDEEEGA